MRKLLHLPCELPVKISKFNHDLLDRWLLHPPCELLSKFSALNEYLFRFAFHLAGQQTTPAERSTGK